MSTPIILSTWSFGRVANTAGYPILSSGGNSLDAVEAACSAVEADPSINSVGFGGIPDASGRLSLDGAIMQSPACCGSVCFVRKHMHPVSIARKVMEGTPHVLLAGEGADQFAIEQGMQPVDLLTDDANAVYQKWLAEQEDKTQNAHTPNVEEATPANTDPENLPHNQDHDTVGVLALDSYGNLAGACSTSGLRFKLPGRVGDSPIIGHGLYVHPKYGAAVATGNGELVMAVCGSFLAVEHMRNGYSPLESAEFVLNRIIEDNNIANDHQIGIITLSPTGQWASASLREGYTTIRTDQTGTERLNPQSILLKT